MKALRLWFSYLKISLKLQLAYRLNFLVESLALITYDFIGPIVITIIYAVSRGLAGWTFEELLLMQGAFIFVFGIYAFSFYGILENTIHKIEDGNFDIVLVKPFSALSFVTASGTIMESVLKPFVGIAVMAFALLKMHMTIAPVNFLMFLLTLVFAITLLYAVTIIFTALAFLVIKTYALIGILESLLSIGRNPLTIYGPVAAAIFTFILPVGLAAFYPASALLGRVSWQTMGELALVTFSFLGLSILIWNQAIRKYTSAGG